MDAGRDSLDSVKKSYPRSLGNKADEISRYQTTSNFELPKDTPFLICSINTSCPLIRVINDNFGLLSCFGELSECNKGVAGGRGGEGRRFFFFFFLTDCLSTVARYFRSWLGVPYLCGRVFQGGVQQSFCKEAPDEVQHLTLLRLFLDRKGTPLVCLPLKNGTAEVCIINEI